MKRLHWHRCKAHGGKFCLWCTGVTFGLPFEHWVWEHTPYAVWLLGLIGVRVG